MNKLEYAQRQVSEVTEVMRQNVAKVMERDDNLAELESKAGDLVMGASQFQTQSTHLKRKMWWKNMKFMMAVGGGCVLLLLFFYVSHSASSKSGTNGVDTPAISPVEKFQNKISTEDAEDDDEDMETVFDEEDEDYRESENKDVLEKDDSKKDDVEVNSHFESLESPTILDEEKSDAAKVDTNGKKSHDEDEDEDYDDEEEDDYDDNDEEDYDDDDDDDEDYDNEDDDDDFDEDDFDEADYVEDDDDDEDYDADEDYNDNEVE